MAAQNGPVNDLVGPAVAADAHRKLYASLAGKARVRVYTFTNNGMVAAFDAAGEQMPEFQGRREDVEERIRRELPDAEWMEPFDFAEAAERLRSPGRPGGTA